MSIGAVIMAGGDGARIAALGVPKPLVQVRGASLLERNLWALLRADLAEIWVACRQGQVEVLGEVARLAVAAKARGVMLRALVEREPLGTVGAAAELRDQVDRLLVVNADNLTALDLAGVLARHARSGADLTLATHDHVVRLPYGEVLVAGDRVLEYREKPISQTRIASAVCVLGPTALAAIDGRTGLHELASKLVAGGRRVRADHHAEAWIDVNEPRDVEAASRLVGEHADRFECWARTPALEVAGAIVRAGDHLLLERRRDSGCWDTPGGKLEAGESASAAIARELGEELGLETVPDELGRFDTLEPDGRAFRHHVFAVSVEREAVCAREGQQLEWFSIGQLPDDRSPVVDRSLAWERR